MLSCFCLYVLICSVFVAVCVCCYFVVAAVAAVVFVVVCVCMFVGLVFGLVWFGGLWRRATFCTALNENENITRLR